MAPRDGTASADYVRTLPTPSRAAELIDISPADITRGIAELGIEPRREKRLAVADLLRLTVHLRRASVEEVAGALLEAVERAAPEHAAAVSTEVVRSVSTLPARSTSEPELFLADLQSALPERYARRAKAIYRRHTGICR